MRNFILLKMYINKLKKFNKNLYYIFIYTCSIY